MFRMRGRREYRLAGSSLAIALLVLPNAALRAASKAPAERVLTPQARAETVPVRNGRDAADDPAIWIHPTVPELSLILGTDKRGGLYVYNMDGTERQVVFETAQPNNVDVLYGFPLSGQKTDLAVAGTRGERSRGVKAWRIDPETRFVSDVTAGGVIPMFGAGEPYGSGVYRSTRTLKPFVFIGDKQGRVEQYELKDAGEGKVGGALVRLLEFNSRVEGIVADDELGQVYIGEEKIGIWKFGAEPDAGLQGKLIAKVKENGLTADVEGLTLYCAKGGRGYLIASSQGNHTFKVYEREGDNRFLLTIDPRRGRIDDVSETDGIAVTSCPTSRQFSKGLLVVQDGRNNWSRQNFKLFAWEDIAGETLLVDTNWSPRVTASEANN